jgi:hypothetical protein
MLPLLGPFVGPYICFAAHGASGGNGLCPSRVSSQSATGSCIPVQTMLSLVPSSHVIPQKPASSDSFSLYLA